MPKDNVDFLDPGEFNTDAVSKQTVKLDRLNAAGEKNAREYETRDLSLSSSTAPCQFLFEHVTENESGCAAGVQQICLHPNHQRARKLWGALVLLTDRLEKVIDDMQTWAENEAGIRGSRKIIRPVNPMTMAGEVDRLHEQMENIRTMLKSEDVKAAKNYSDSYEFTESGFVAEGMEHDEL